MRDLPFTELDKVVVRFGELRARIEAEAHGLVAKPGKVLPDLKDEQIPVMSGFAGVGKSERQVRETPYVGYLRALAKRDIPKQFKWEIATVMGGHAHLVLVDYDPET